MNSDIKKTTPEELQALCEEIITHPKFEITDVRNGFVIYKPERFADILAIRRKGLFLFPVYSVNLLGVSIRVPNPKRLYRMAKSRLHDDDAAWQNEQLCKAYEAAKKKINPETTTKENE